jgi:hypothetical protein
VAVVYPERDGVLKRLDGAEPTPERVREIVAQGIREQEADVASFKRVVEIILTDEPLPRTPIRKVMRGHIRESYDFDTDRWARSWSDLQNSLATPPADAEAEEEAAIPA